MSSTRKICDFSSNALAGLIFSISTLSDIPRIVLKRFALSAASSDLFVR